MAEPIGLVFIIIAAYLVGGSASLGYLMLRVGWPKVRTLDKPYKTGWAILLGLVFSAIVVAFSIAEFYIATGIAPGGALGLMPGWVSGIAVPALSPEALLALNILAGFPLALLVLTARRKFFSKRKVSVAVPKDVVSARIVTSKAMGRLALDKAFIQVSGIDFEKARELRELLKKKAGQQEPKPQSSAQKAISTGKKAGQDEPATAVANTAGAAQGSGEKKENKKENSIAKKPLEGDNA